MGNSKQFDLGLYTFKRQVSGPLCPQDDRLAKNGEVVAVLHPMQNVDGSGLYCFGVAKSDLATKTLVRKNLKFSKVITLSFNKDTTHSQVEEVHAKLNAAVIYLKSQEGGQLQLLEAAGRNHALLESQA